MATFGIDVWLVDLVLGYAESDLQRLEALGEGILSRDGLRIGVTLEREAEDAEAALAEARALALAAVGHGSIMRATVFDARSAPRAARERPSVEQHR